MFLRIVKKQLNILKDFLKQTLKDFDKQDKVDEYDYSIEIPEIKLNLWNGGSLI